VLPEESLQELMRLAGVVLSHEDIHTALNEVCQIAARAIPGAEAASLTAINERGPSAVAASDEWAWSLDEIQFEELEGPCLDAARSGVVFRIRDTEKEPRWPNYMPRAAERGTRSMVSLPVSVESKTTGALNVYARSPDVFGPVEVSVAEVIAGHASLVSQTAAALFRHKEIALQLQEAMTSRAVIEQAKGILMSAGRCTAEQAFELLVEASQRRNVKLRDVAARVVETGTLEA
jgi:GAF domain-containing protein